jgi:hypothetical protein
MEKYRIDLKAIKVEYIAELYPKNGITLFHGTYGSGKSYSVLKSLNDSGIKPIYIALEISDGLQEFDIDAYSELALTPLVNGEFDDQVRDRVIVFDTYTRIMNMYQKIEDDDIYKLFEKLKNRTNSTLIIIGHTSEFVGKQDLFKDNVVLARNADEVLYLEKTVYKATKVIPAHIEYNLHVQKGRGNGGSRIIENWMRD